MARQILTKTTTPSPHPTAGVAVTMTAEDTVNNSRFTQTGREILLVHNTHAVTGYTYTVSSVADEAGRTLDITAQAIVAGAIHTVGPFSMRPGWTQTDGYIYCAANNIAVKFGVILLPG